MARSLKDKNKVTQLLMLLKKFQMSPIANQAEYERKNTVNLTTNQRNYGYKMIIQKSIQHIMKENMLLLKNLLEP